MFGDLFQTVLPEGNVIEYGYDAAGRMTSIERKPDDMAASHGERTVYTLDGFGHRVSESLQRWDGTQWVEHSATDYVYSSRCHLDQRIDGAGSANESVTEFAYDCEDLLVDEWDANHPSSGQTMPPSKSYFYDDLHRLSTIQEPWGGAGGGTLETDYGYDRQDHLASVTDGEGNATTYETSDRDLLTEEESPVSGTTSYAYYDNGQLETRTDARGVVETRTVDEASRTTHVEYPDSTLDTTYTYDDPGVPFSAGRLTSIERNGEAVDFEYDRFGRMTRDGDLTYQYDMNGNRTEIGYPGGGVARYTHDYADRELTLEYEPLGGPVQPIVTDAAYLPSGPLDALIFDNGISEARAFDERYHPDRITATGPGGTAFDWDYTTDSVGNPTAIADLVNGGGSNRTYAYQDIQYFLTTGNGPWGTRAWTYDRIGNRLSETADGGPADAYSYVAGVSGNTAILDEIQLGSGGSRTYLYGPAGHLEQITAGGALVDFASDDAGRLTRIEGSIDSVFLYDGRSFLANSRSSVPIFADGFESGDVGCWSAVVGGSPGGACPTPPPTGTSSTTELVYSTEGVVHAFVNTEDANQRARTQFYFAGRPVAQLEVPSGGGDVWTLLTTDHLGTPAASTDLAGALVWQGGFEPFGRDWQEGTANGASENGLQLRLPGQWDDETWSGAGLYYNLHRWSSPELGLYTRPDPAGLIWSDLKLYSYTGMRPTSLVDPSGLVTCVAISGKSLLGGLMQFGDHAAVMILGSCGKKDGEDCSSPGRTLYDPAGGYVRQFDEAGTGDLLSSEVPGWSPEGFFDYHCDSGSDYVEVYCFPTSCCEEQEIYDQIPLGGAGAAQCAINSGSVLSGVGPFDGLRGTTTPELLRRAMNRLLQNHIGGKFEHSCPRSSS